MDARLIVVLLGVFLSEQANGLNCTDGMKGLTKYIPCGFRQSSTHCMANTWECDDFTDCPDGSDETFCHYPGRGKTGYIFEYNYTGDVVFPDRSDGLQIETQVMIEKDSTKTKTRTIMKLENPKLFQKANKARGSLLSAKDKAVWEKPIVFDILNNGAITNLRTEGREPDDVLNIKRSIASLFQMRLESTTDYENEETDSTGTCRMKYSVTKKQTFQEPYKSPLKSRKLAALHKYNITKTNDYSDCKYRPAHSFSNVDPIICSDKSKNPFLKSRMKMSCIIYKYDDGKGRQKEPFIHSCHSRERHELNSFAKNKASTPFIVHAERQLSFVQVTTRLITSKLNRPKTKTSLLFSFDGLTKPSFIPNAQDDIDEIKGILEKLTKLAKKDTIAYDLMDFEVPKLYLHLVIHLRWRSKPSTFATIYGRFFKGDYRFWLESALPFFGTEASGAEIHMRIEKGEITEQGAIKLLSRLGVVGDPDKGLLDHILKLCKSPKVKNETVSSTCWLAFGSLVRDYCRGKSSCPQTYIQELKNKYVENLHSQDHHMEVIKDNEKLIIALKAIGNAGQIAHLRLSLDILTKWNDHNAIMIAAIESLRRMPLEADAANLLKAQMALLQIFSNKKMCPEIRIVAFSALLNTGPATNMIINLTSTIRSEVNPLVKHYVYTHLKSESKVNCEQKKSCKASRDLQRRLSNVPHEEFDPRFSFSMSHSFEETGIFQLYKEMINMEVVHTPVSAIPRFLKFKNTMKMVGLQFDHMEFKLRQREIVKLMRDLIGPYGSVYDKKTLWDFIRTKRSAKDSFPEVYRRMQETINPKTKSDIPFKATVSSKLFGAEILYLVLNETNPFIQTLIEDGTIKIDKNWWSNSLKAGMNFNVSANDLLFNSIIIIPTCTGIPLHLRANIAGSFAYNFYAEMKSSPMMNLWSWSNKPKDISGTFKECYSMSTYSHGRMYWFYRDSRMGFATHHSISNRCPAPVEKLTFSVQPPSQKLNVTMILAKSKYVHQNSSLSITRFARIKSKNEYEKPVKVKQVPTKSGFSTFFDSMMGGRQGNPQPGPFMGPNPGQGPYMGGPPPGQPQFKDGPNPGSKTAGQLPNPGQGPNRGGPNPGKPQFIDGPNPGSKTLGQNPGPLPNPGQGPNMGRQKHGGSFIDGPPKSVFAKEEEASVNCNTVSQAFLHLEVCSSTENDEKSYREMSWYTPVKNRVDNVEFLYQNVTKDDDKERRFDMQLHLNGENQTTLTEFHIELNTSGKSLEKSPLEGIPNYLGFSLKAFQKTDGKVKHVGCLNSRINMAARQLDIGLGWGKNCSHYAINTTYVYNGKVKNARLDFYSSWKSLPENLEKLTCPKKYLQKQLEKLKGMNAGMGGQGGMGGPQSGMGGPQSGMGGPQSGMGAPPSGMGAPPSGMGGPQSGMGRPPSGMGGPPSGMANSGSSSGMGIPGMGNLPCWTSVNLSISIKDGKRLIMKGFPTPNAEIANFTLPFNSTKAIAKAKDILTYGITDTCKVYRNTENIITFDQRTYSYKPSVGCPHVLAKDCSDKDLFVVFLKRNAKDEKEVTLVVKDKRKRGHTFVIKPDLTVMHDGSALQLKGASKYKSANMPHLCRVTKSDDKVVIRCIAGVSVIANTKKIKVKVTPWYFRYMCGMCGNNNWMASDDIRKSSNADHLGASWLVPGKSCNSECTLVHRPVESKVGKTNKLCITTSPVTRCAPNCQPTKTTTAKFGYNCIDKSSDLAKKTQQQLSNQKFQKVIDAFRNKSKDMKENTEVHVDCQCNCPKS